MEKFEGFIETEWFSIFKRMTRIQLGRGRGIPEKSPPKKKKRCRRARDNEQKGRTKAEVKDPEKLKYDEL